MLGLHHTLIKWIHSFLSDRSIAVIVDGFLSNLHLINTGVPQGSVISPVPLILFINSLLTYTSSSIHFFADDTFLSSSFSLQRNSAYEWNPTTTTTTLDHCPTFAYRMIIGPFSVFMVHARFLYADDADSIFVRCCY